MVIRPFDSSGIVRGEDGILRYLNRPTSLVAMLTEVAERDPAAEAIVELGGRRLSYGELLDEVSRVAGGLRDVGVGRGDRVAINLPNGVDWCLAYFGTIFAGGIVVPINTRFSQSEVDYVVDDSGARLLVSAGDALPTGEPYVDAGLEPEDVAAIVYTSGTTGFPKGAVTTHANLLSNNESCRRALFLEPGTRVRNLISVPLFHVTGCNSQLLLTTELGGASVIMPAFSVDGFLDAIVDERIDMLTSVPAIYLLAISSPRFASTDVSTVRWISYGGAPIAPDTVRRLREEFPDARLGNGFGLTECASLATYLPHEYCETRPETVGFAVPVVELVIDDPDPRTGAGELLVRGPNVVKGYWNKPEATAGTFVDGWLRTGDVAVLDDEGFLQIVDRRKDMVNRGGENVYSIEVENALISHPSVAEAAVVGVPDDVMGEKVGAVVVPVDGATVDVDELIAHVAGLIADFKVPQYLIVQPVPLPRNPNGKVLKQMIRDLTQWGTPLR